MKSFKYRLKLNENQELILNTLSNEHRVLYNHLLDYIKKSNTFDFNAINQEYKQFRLNNCLTINSKSAQNTSRTLINNIKSFYGLRKKDKTAKFPYKFKSYKEFFSFMLDYNNGNGGFKIEENCISISLNSCTRKLRINTNPNIFSKFGINDKTIKTITILKEGIYYYMSFIYSENESNYVGDKNNFLSIDLGMSNIATCYSNVINSFSINNCKYDKLEKTSTYIQSIKDKKKKYSKKYKQINQLLNKNKRKRSNKLKDYHHKLSKTLISICKTNNVGVIICGDIKIKKVIKKENKGLKSTSKNFGLSRFKTFLEYKAKNENIDFIKVNEAYTSQNNSLTGTRDFKDIPLSQRTVKLSEIIEIDRDLNSAINIAKKIRENAIPNFETLSFNKMYMNQFSKLICM